jgi:hypothetical protein
VKKRQRSKKLLLKRLPKLKLMLRLPLRKHLMNKHSLKPQLKKLEMKPPLPSKPQIRKQATTSTTGLKLETLK